MLIDIRVQINPRKKQQNTGFLSHDEAQDQFQTHSYHFQGPIWISGYLPQRINNRELRNNKGLLLMEHIPSSLSLSLSLFLLKELSALLLQNYETPRPLQ